MTKLLLWISFALVIALSSCAKDEIVEEGFLYPFYLTALAADSEATVKFTMPYFATLSLVNINFATPDSYELFSSNSLHGEYRREVMLFGKRLSEYKLENLDNGVPLYITLRTNKKGSPSAQSDTIMVIPSKKPKVNAFFQLADSQILNASISPNQRMVAFVSNNVSGKFTNTQNLYIHDRETGATKKIEEGVNDCDWSAVQNNIAFVHELIDAPSTQYTLHLAIYDYESASTTYLPVQSQRLSGIKFSPDGLWIIYLTNEGVGGTSLWRIRKDGTDNQELFSQSNAEMQIISDLVIEKAHFSADGQAIFLSASVLGNSSIYKYKMSSGLVEPVIVDKWADYSPVLSPDGKNMAFFSSRSGQYAIWLYNFSKQSYAQVTGDNNRMFVEPNGSKIGWLNNSQLFFTGYDNSYQMFTVTID